jgi:hypothetical protein
MSTFYSFEHWCSYVLHPEDTNPWNFLTREFYEEYRTKYVIAKMVAPTSILEIGVRFGYGAHSFLLAAPTARYVGLDCDEPSWGPYKGKPREWAERHLRAYFPRAAIATFACNTQRDELPTLSTADLVHIDADHSLKGALRDMLNFWPVTRRVMVIDDYGEIPAVRDAVKGFIEHEHPHAILLPITSMRGSAILVRDGWRPL